MHSASDRPDKLLELHIVQSFPPGNPNRDDTGQPKTAIFGGVPRARISSQASKRAIRMLFADELRAIRTRKTKEKLLELVMKKLDDPSKSKQKDAEAFIDKVVAQMTSDGKNKDREKAKGEAIVFLSTKEFEALADAIVDQKSDDDIQGILTQPSYRSLDQALFGRMLASFPAGNIDAAARVAHVISTHRAAAEWDFFTVVDDLQKPESDDRGQGAAHMNGSWFVSACYYRYLSVDIAQLRHNLGDKQVTSDTLKELLDHFLDAAVRAIPSGQQTTKATQNPPVFVLATLSKETCGLALHNAFEQPVPWDKKRGWIEPSVERLACHYAEMADAYRINGIRGAALYVGKQQLPSCLCRDEIRRVSSLEELRKWLQEGIELDKVAEDREADVNGDNAST